MFNYKKPQYAETDVAEIIWKRINDYVTHGRPLGNFLTAVMENDFKEAIARADVTNLRHIYEIMIYICNEIPALCQGSPQRVKIWQSHQLHCAMAMIAHGKVCSCCGDAAEGEARDDEIRKGWGL